MIRSIPLLILALATGLALVAPARGVEPALQATLVDASKLAAQAGAKIEVVVTGLELVDPASVQELPRPGEDLHYRVDQGPVIASETLRVSVPLAAGDRHTP